MIRRSISCLVAIGLLFHSYISAKACGPSYLQSIFVFEESPDKRVLQWAKSDPNDPRIPEALFIAGKANQSYKYGCNGWENDKETEQEAIKILSEQYPQSPWTAKLEKPEDQ